LAFETLKESLTKAPVLAFADPQLPYVPHVDTSREGLGGVLYQDHGEGLRSVAFMSRSLTTSEHNYPAHKLEFIVFKWAVVDKLHEYLYKVKFKVRPEFSLKFRPGRQNIDANALSRHSH
jgi:hypothetical protein